MSEKAALWTVAAMVYDAKLTSTIGLVIWQRATEDLIQGDAELELPFRLSRTVLSLKLSLFVLFIYSYDIITSIEL